VDTSGAIDNIAVTHATTGEVIYIDATNISQTGTDLISIAGTYNIFDTLINIRDTLENNHSLPDHQLTQALYHSIDSVTEIHDLLIQTDVTLGSRTGFLDKLRQTLEEMEYDTQEEASTLEEVDIAQVAIDLSRREVLYELSLSIAGKLMSISLLDFIR
jgi:flagellin-like hook-associated protein FlgL